MYKEYLVLNYLQCLISKKNQLSNQPTKSIYFINDDSFTRSACFDIYTSRNIMPLAIVGKRPIYKIIFFLSLEKKTQTFHSDK